MTVASDDGDPPSLRNTFIMQHVCPTTLGLKMKASIPMLLLFHIRNPPVLNATAETS